METEQIMGVDSYLPINITAEQGKDVIYLKNVGLAWEQTSEQTRARVKSSYQNQKIDELEIWETEAEKSSTESKSVVVSLSNILELQPVEINKPWGKEVWYTGIEQRGVSKIGSPSANIRISTLHKLLGDSFLESSKDSPILLKILAPNNHPTLGNLYYELHTEKEEVYIVSSVNDVWKNKIGKMKYGVSDSKKADFKDELEFKKAFKEAVKAYEKIRFEIEDELTKIRHKESNLKNHELTVVEAYKMLPAQLVEKEQHAKTELESFVGWKNLKVGDVVSVETCVPHSLQHGVEVIEFQTPVYERFIISFDQKVLTQNHWDVESAFEVMKLKTPQTTTLKLIHQDEAYREEEVAVFDDFFVSRLTIKKSFDFHTNGKHAVAFLLEGYTTSNISNNSKQLEAGKAYYILPMHNGVRFENSKNDASIILLARPR